MGLTPKRPRSPLLHCLQGSPFHISDLNNRSWNFCPQRRVNYQAFIPSPWPSRIWILCAIFLPSGKKLLEPSRLPELACYNFSQPFLWLKEKCVFLWFPSARPPQSHRTDDIPHVVEESEHILPRTSSKYWPSATCNIRSFGSPHNPLVSFSPISISILAVHKPWGIAKCLQLCVLSAHNSAWHRVNDVNVQ